MSYTDIRIGVYIVLLITLLENSLVNASGSPDGRELFSRHCLLCHNGSVDKAPPLENLQNRQADMLSKTITVGIMKPMARHLSDEERQKIVSYIISTKKKDAPDNPLLMCQSGEKLV